jgi:hypothetical protein
MITLDTGMVLLIITIVEKVFTPIRFYKNRFNTALLSISLFCFIGSLFFSLRALVVISNRLIEMLQGGVIDTLVDKLSFYGSIYSFFGGVLLFFGLAIISFYSGPVLDTRRQRVYTLRKNAKKR